MRPLHTGVDYPGKGFPLTYYFDTLDSIINSKETPPMNAVNRETTTKDAKDLKVGETIILFGQELEVDYVQVAHDRSDLIYLDFSGSNASPGYIYLGAGALVEVVVPPTTPHQLLVTVEATDREQAEALVEEAGFTLAAEKPEPTAVTTVPPVGTLVRSDTDSFLIKVGPDHWIRYWDYDLEQGDTDSPVDPSALRDGSLPNNFYTVVGNAVTHPYVLLLTGEEWAHLPVEERVVRGKAWGDDIRTGEVIHFDLDGAPASRHPNAHTSPAAHYSSVVLFGPEATE